MMTIPENVIQEIMTIVYAKADEVGYLTFTKPQSGAFMDVLVQMPEVGGVLSSFMEKGKVKTYIKDAILHDYTDKKKLEQVPNAESFVKWCREKYGMTDVGVMESIDKPWRKIALLISPSTKTYFVIADGSFKQWGVALQKALEYMSDKPFVYRIGNTVRIVLSLYCKGTPLSHIDKTQLAKALAFIGGSYRLYGETC